MSVVLFRRTVDDFKTAARVRGFQVGCCLGGCVVCVLGGGGVVDLNTAARVCGCMVSAACLRDEDWNGVQGTGRGRGFHCCAHSDDVMMAARVRGFQVAAACA